MSYAKALKKLEKLPPGERQLAAGQYVWEVKNGKSHCGCAIGKQLTEKQRVKMFKAGPNKSGTDDLSEFLGIEVFDRGSFIGVADLTVQEADRLQGMNDTFGRAKNKPFVNVNDYKTRKARYKHVVAWLKARIADKEPEFTPDEEGSF